MISYVFSILEKQIHWDKVYQILKQKYGDTFELVFGIKKGNSELDDLLALQKKHKDSVTVVVLENNASENQILNEALKKSKGTHIVMCRDYFEFTTVMSDVLLAMGYQGVQLAMYQKIKKTNKIKEFFKKIYNKLVSWIFGFSMYDGDIGLMFFGNVTASTLRTLNNPSLLTKVNRWAGIEPSYVRIEELKKPKLEKSLLKNNIIWLCLSLVLFIGTLVGFILLVNFGLLNFIQGFLMVVGMIVFLLWALYLVLKLSVVCKVGDLK